MPRLTLKVHISIFILAISIFCSCSPKNISLQDKLGDFSIISDELVACAAKGFEADITTDIQPVDVYYKTRLGQTNVSLWYNDKYEQSLENYQLLDLSDTKLFEGFMGLFEYDYGNGAVIVSFEISDTLYYSKPIELRWEDTGTVLDTNVSSDTSIVGQPRFSWPASTFDSESIYFTLIVDQESNEAISGTYTFENTWQFYDLSNVVFNVTERINPSLESGKTYFVQVMHVSDNNWVSKIERGTFIAN